MHLPWRGMPPAEGGQPISTSLTVNEAAALADLATGRDVLEVGSAFGFSACVMALAGAKHVTAVDPHTWLNSHEAMAANLDAAGVADAVTIVRGASPGALEGLGPFGLVFIDGDHDAAAVTADVEAGSSRRRRVACPTSAKTAAARVCGRSRCTVPAGPDEHVDTWRSTGSREGSGHRAGRAETGRHRRMHVWRGRRTRRDDDRAAAP
jgi:hypothetical protein